MICSAACSITCCHALTQARCPTGCQRSRTADCFFCLMLNTCCSARCPPNAVVAASFKTLSGATVAKMTTARSCNIGWELHIAVVLSQRNYQGIDDAFIGIQDTRIHVFALYLVLLLLFFVETLKNHRYSIRVHTHGAEGRTECRWF